MAEDRAVPRFERLYALLFIPTAGAVAINLFMLALIARAFGWPSLSPNMTLLLSVPIALPVNWVATRWIRGLIRKAEETR
ncbi:hypothetical protein [Pontibaca methylaminivorans]|uniref:NnrT protein n=1 Tax=Pontibaca methylaminivorans TaxID=515897 RepID=A0A1R3WKZ1_9RHOB|nr:hypothetical protein [Pontibaca methylaminivorans]SIT78769.1 hypothetical protein SAMN05421849_1015 [Pontibaca methylaminivorans]